MHSSHEAELPHCWKVLEIPLRDSERMEMPFSSPCKEREDNTWIRNLCLIYKWTFQLESVGWKIQKTPHSRSWNGTDTGSLMSRHRAQHQDIKSSGTKQPLPSCFITLRAPSLSSWSRMCSGHGTSILRSRTKGLGEGSSFWRPAYVPSARPRHIAIPLDKRWLRNVVLMYAVNQSCA